ncbi:MAG: DUF401 family protein [Candidatus Nezhaarchaeales archaeon]|nr:MAG: hypothetical protein DSO06_06270 [Candidatus Nezhaarchaeota archaeon WYZ-LMO8]TDA35488.1 MAG: hypothetical protein DSO05_05205 [Candidatus Nezhaarchaeota archaeon WYZ-LMO7]
MLLDPVSSLVLTFCLLGFLLYKKVSVGLVLVIAPILLALLTLKPADALMVLYDVIDPYSQSGLFALLIMTSTFFIAWLSYLYDDCGEVRNLGDSLNRFTKRTGLLLALSPAIMSLLPIAGGALLSAPIVSSLIKDSNLCPARGSYINLWFRHVPVLVYPLAQSIILASALTGTPLFIVILFQTPVVVVMTVVGYFLGLRGGTYRKVEELTWNRGDVKILVKSILPIASATALAITLSITWKGLVQQGLSLLVASVTGIIVLITISRMARKIIGKSLLKWGIYDVTLATYGAFLFQNVMTIAGIPSVLKPLALSSTSELPLLASMPLLLSFLMGSVISSLTISTSMLAGTIEFTPKMVMLLYTSSFLGYVISPLHLCLVFTLKYFNTTLYEFYKYAIPSTVMTYLATLLFYFILP